MVGQSQRRLGACALVLWALAARAEADTTSACSPSARVESVAADARLGQDKEAPELASGYRTGLKAVQTERYMVIAAHPLAASAGCQVLAAGGNAVDAAVAVQMVLGLVEPQSSGIGGGALMLYYDAATGQVTAYDGRETAPAAAQADDLRWVDAQSRVTPQPDTRSSGRSIGTPGVLRMLEMAHAEHGKQPWSVLFAPAIALAEQGFAVSGRMASALAAAQPRLRHDADAAAVYLKDDLTPWQQGEHFVNAPYADALRRIAAQGADGFYLGPLAQAIVAKVAMDRSAWDGSPVTPGRLSLDDLRDYRPQARAAVCTRYRVDWVCGMPPPSSGGLAVAQILGVLAHFDLAAMAPAAPDGDGGIPSAQAIHLISEASRLAYADRDRYVADSDFVPLPGGSWAAMLAPDYLRQRAALVDPQRSMGVAQAGEFGQARAGLAPVAEAGTTHVSIVDAQGNAVALTSSVEAGMGSYHVTHGFVLNNQLTDFAATPSVDGAPVANRLAPGKRPRSSMAPTLVFETAPDGGLGPLKMVTGSPGGANIIQYVAKTLVGVLDWGLDAQQASSLANFGASNRPQTQIGGEHPMFGGQDPQSHPVVQALRERGHEVVTQSQASGVATIRRVARPGQAPYWQGGVDPRREGLVLGE